MIAFRNSIILILFLFSSFGTEIVAESGIWREILLENFELSNFDANNLRTKLEKGTKLPEISLSSNFTAPIPGSKQALVLRIPKEANFPFSLYFPKPIEVNAFIKEITIPIYSSRSSGNLTLIIETQDAEVKQLNLTSLNFRGWNTITVSISKNFDQNDRVFLQKSSIRILGFFYLPYENNDPNQEVLIAIDDITAIVRDKYRPLRNKEILLED
ncbi:flagellar filament outer layer protein Flaa domain protein [Leptospira yanagawae serovar Saopaulo str. Sao Paulo = ATCC 700523]|uniref:Flagellar assembly protein FlaA n=2 Tax=Leptospira yanagawae TaxID=293069 RepID=A0ABY2M0J2_9LEPT|nr:flagellar filament outer layer protein Flaa domain protein [Leptospira yanagawae serovar Saopaulo str. Sao Paulo = ATCC 700523]TGL20029.1 flagellar assembly protein FlaA [Leptospira yanagawae]